MPDFVVLLRGVNVGKGNPVPMADFRAMLEDLGYSSVKTLLNSGNAMFGALSSAPPELADRIAAAVEERFGVITPVIVKSAKEVTEIIDANPMVPPKSDHSRFLVVFTMHADRLTELDALQSLILPGERFVVTAQAAYLYCPNGVLESQVGKALLGKAARDVTTRNWGTVLKLARLMGHG